MDNTFCQRCRKPSAIRSMSWFNTQMICPECADKEQNHPRFKEAVVAERKAVRRGERNFPGLGCRMIYDNVMPVDPFGEILPKTFFTPQKIRARIVKRDFILNNPPFKKKEK